MRNNKAVVLIISLVVMVIMLVFTGAYFSSLFTEKKSSDTERFLLQALHLAEAGANHGVAELRERIRTDLKNTLQATPKNTVSRNLRDIYAQQDPLSILEDYAQFTVSGGQAAFNSTALNLNTGVQGTYAATVRLTPQVVAQNPVQISDNQFRFYYDYSVTATGSVPAANIQKTIKLYSGSTVVDVHLDNFAKYALFTSHHTTPSGTTVWFTANTNFSGPVATNDRFSFANNPSGHFTQKVTQFQNTARFYNNGSPLFLDANNNVNLDVPLFDRTFERSQPIINLPSAVSQTDLKTQALGGVSEPGSTGVFVPNDGTNVIGGIYVRGNQGQSADNAAIAMSKDGSNNPVYAITQSGATTTVTVDYTINQTKVQTASTTRIYQGIPDGVGNEGVILYVNDDIKSLSGMVQQDSEVTISGERDIVITNNITYEKDPRVAGNENYKNLLGILSWGGNVRIGASAPNNVVINGVVMAHNGIFTVDNYNSGSPRGVATLLGGAITSFYGAFGTFSGSTPRSGYGRNFVYDARMLQGLAPPYFPYIGTYTCSDDGGLDAKLTWHDGGV